MTAVMSWRVKLEAPAIEQAKSFEVLFFGLFYIFKGASL